MPNIFINKWGLALLRIVGIAAFSYNAFSKWEYEWWVEILILVFFFVVAIYPSRVKVIFDKAFNKVKNKASKSLESDTGGKLPEDDEEV